LEIIPMEARVSRRVVGVVLVGLFVLTVAGVASAAVPSSDGTISACVGRKGAIRVIDAEAGQACARTERPLDWNQQAPAAPAAAIRSGLCRHDVPKTVRAGDNLAVSCPYAEPFAARTVTASPAFSDSFAEPTYVLQLGVDYTYQIDLDSGSNDEFVVIVRILRDILPPFPTPDIDYHSLLLNYIAVGSEA
jgi:hypothetical protein